MADEYRTYLVILALGIVYFLEGLFPFFHDRRHHFRHTARNLTIGGCNIAIVSFLFSAISVSAMLFAEKKQIGLSYLLGLSGYGQLIVSFFLIDLWMYLWHRINHEVPFLWRFHRVHHSDTEMDASTAVRFHPGEIALSQVLRLPVLMVIGVVPEHLVVYETCLLLVIIFHHSNMAVPPSIEKILSTIIVTPNIHRVHHSDKVSETNSNYASVFSIWDVLFGTRVNKKDIASIRLGLKEFRTDTWQSLPGMLRTPLEKLARPKSSTSKKSSNSS